MLCACEYIEKLYKHEKLCFLSTFKLHVCLHLRVILVPLSEVVLKKIEIKQRRILLQEHYGFQRAP